MKKIDMSKALGIPDVEYLPTPNSFNFLLENLRRANGVEIFKQFPGVNLLFSFMLDDEKWFFKYESLFTPYSELFSEELCHDLGFPCVHYELARIGDIEGVASPNYKKEKTNYVTGKEILFDCYLEEIDEELSNIYGFPVRGDLDLIMPELKRYNSLDAIWHALEKRYASHEYAEEIVAKLMDQIVDMYILDMLTGQVDRTMNNWEVAEHQSGEVELSPIFDNTRIFHCHPTVTRIAMAVNKNAVAPTNRYLINNVERFLKESSSEFVEKLKRSLFVLEEQNVESILRRIEEKTKAPMPERLKEQYRQVSEIQLEFLQEMIESYEFGHAGKSL